MKETDPAWARKLAALFFGALVIWFVIYPGVLAMLTMRHIESRYSIPGKSDGWQAVRTGGLYVTTGLILLGIFWWMAWGSEE
jgi:hypothetical protein